MNSSYPRGSEWRKWDLHIHSASTVFNNQFSGSTEDEKWKNYFNKIEKYDDIIAIGVTDYFSISGYKKVLDYKEKGGMKNIDLILPNVELRIIPTGLDKSIDLHIIFSNEIVQYLESQFFQELEFIYKEINYKCTYSDLINLGKVYKPNISNEKKAYKIGCDQFKVSIKELIELFKKYPNLRKNSLIGVSNRSIGGVSGLKESNLKALRQEIYRFCDFVFSANPNDIEYFLGQGVDSEEKIISDYGSLKSCLHGCDAHKNNEIFKPDNDRFTWIKADPTFEGLNQIIYEPKQRVRIQKDKPEEKLPHNVIKSFTFLTNKNDKTFIKDRIFLNTNLTSIIGGKSSGKSLLLNYISKTANKIYVDNILESSKLSIFDFEETNKNFDFEIEWEDEEKVKLKDDNENNYRPITYIPQSYIYQIADKKSIKELQSLILDILRQNNLFNNLYKSTMDFVSKKYKILDKLLVDLKQIEDKIKIGEVEYKKLGNKNAIKKSLSLISKKIENLKKAIKITDEESKKFQTLLKEEEEFKNKKIILQNRYDTFENLETNIIELKDEFLQSLNELIEDSIIDLSDDEAGKKILINLEKELKLYIENGLNELVKKKLSKKNFEAEEKKLDSKIKKNNEELKPYYKKIEGQVTLKKYINEKEKNDSLIIKIDKKEKQIEKLRENYNKKLIVLLELYKEIYNKHIALKDEFRKKELQFETGDILLNINIIFGSKEFQKKFVNSTFDGRCNLSIKFNFFNSENSFHYQTDKHIENISELMRLLIDNFYDEEWHNEIRFLKGYDKIEALRTLFKNYFNYEFEIIHKGDKFEKMSPGKKGLVLLKLLLHFSNDEHPIIIDQPEENIDTRTLTENLVNFIKEKKIQRQIIIVTHNANLVVLADSELVIVANQAGQEINRDNKEYKFEYIGGAMEHTFKNISENGILYQMGIREHICEILEGGEKAFKERERKYHLTD